MPEQTSFKQNTTVVLLNNAKVKLTALFAQIEAKKKKKRLEQDFCGQREMCNFNN